MVKKTYICNLCRQEFGEDKQAEIVGFDFSGDQMARPQTNWQANNHICLNCIEVVKTIDGLLQRTPAADAR